MPPFAGPERTLRHYGGTRSSPFPSLPCKWHADSVDQEPNLIQLLLATWRSGILIPECLPQVATELLVQGFDSPALRTLAGIDLGPFDPREATDLLADTITELSISEPSTLERLELASAILAYQCVAGTVSPRRTTHRFYSLVVREGYPKEPAELMEFYMFDDDWDSGVVSRDQVEQEVSAKAADLLSRLGLSHWEPPTLILNAILTGP